MAHMDGSDGQNEETQGEESDAAMKVVGCWWWWVLFGDGGEDGLEVNVSRCVG